MAKIIKCAFFFAQRKLIKIKMKGFFYEKIVMKLTIYRVSMRH